MNIVASPTREKKTDREISRQLIYHDGAFAEKEANQILAVCRHFSFRELDNLRCLYLGSINNIKIECLSHNFRKLYVLDTDNSKIDIKQNTSDQSKIKYIDCSNGNLSLDDLTVDVIICDRFCNRVDRPEELMYEIYRILRNDGFCYFSAKNKMSLHKGKYNSSLLTLPKLRRLIDNFWKHDYVGLIRQNPLVFQAQDQIGSRQGKLKANGRLLKYIYPFLPLWVWVLTKKK